MYRPHDGVGWGLNLSTPIKPFRLGTRHHEAERCALWGDALSGGIDEKHVFDFCMNTKNLENMVNEYASDIDRDLDNGDEWDFSKHHY